MQAHSGAGSRADAGHRLILSAAQTPVECELIERWAADRDAASAGVTAGATRGATGVSAQAGGVSDAFGVPEVIDLTPEALAKRLQDGGDPLLVPVRIVWLPKERDGRREVGWTDLLTLRNPRRPSARQQGRLADQDHERYQVVAAEPARASELRRRFLQHSSPEPTGPASALAAPEEYGGPGADPLGFGRFVYRQATLALERAERAVIGDKYKVPRLVVDEITTGARYRQRVAELAQRLNLPADEVAERAADSLREVVAVQSRLTVDLFGTTMRPLHARAWKVRTQPEELARLRELNRRSALIFLPSHRSYADTLVLADVLHGNDFPRNHVVSGDNLARWPFAPLARRAGLVFIRRSFREDEVYKLAVQEYFGYLVAKRFNLEWYFEGGRSRTGKLRPPKFGLLTYLAGALRNEPGIDVQLVPVSITYERLAEVSSMAAEQQGGRKQREGLRWLARYARNQRRAAGEAVVRFGTPIGMRQGLGPDDADGGAQKLALSKLAFEVAVGINRATPVLPASLVTLALLGVRDRALTLEQVERILRPLLDYVEVRGLPTSGTPALRNPVRVAAVLDGLAKADVVSTYTGGDEPVYSITPGQHLVAAFYRNNSIHWFVNRAIVELTMIALAERGAERIVADGWAQALALRDLLKYEFFFPDKDAFRAELRGELELIDPNWSMRGGSVGDARELLAATGFLLAHRVLRSFVEAELVVAELLLRRGEQPLSNEKQFLTDCAGIGQQMLLQGRVHSAEALSGELFAAALRLAEGRRLLTAEAGPLLKARRAAFAGELRQVAGWIAQAAEIDRGTAIAPSAS